jgi:peptide/nickel transport system substrate-binding protein
MWGGSAPATPTIEVGWRALASANRLLGLVQIVVMTACTKIGMSGDGGVRHPYTIPHELRFATGEDIDGLNTHLYNADTTVEYLSALTAAWLTRTGQHNEPVPELATIVPSKANGGISSDGKTITWHLRKGVVWSDGAPFTADDVVFSTRAVLNPANDETGRLGWNLITRIDEPNKFTVVYHLKQPYGGFAYRYFSSAGDQSVLPKHLLGGFPNINTAQYNELPVGIGPFKYKLWKRSDFVEMVANPTYFRGKPKLERIVCKLMTNFDTIFSQLTTHEIDLWPFAAGPYYGRMHATAGIAIQRLPSYNFFHIDLNTSHPALRERAVRQALLLAIDRPLYLRKLRHGLGIVQDNVVASANPAFDPSVPTTKFDLAAANRVLDRAGWVRGADGVRAKGGVRLALVLPTYPGAPYLDQLIELMRGWYRQIGVELEVTRFPTAGAFSSYQGGGIVETGKFDLLMLGSFDDPLGDLQGRYGCSQSPPKGSNYTRYCNPKVDAAMQAFARLYTARERQPYANFIQEQLQRDVPTLVTDNSVGIYAYNSDLKGFHPNQVQAFDDFMDVDI